MKIEFLHHYHARHGLPLKERLIAHLPRYAPFAALAGAAAQSARPRPGSSPGDGALARPLGPAHPAALAPALARGAARSRTPGDVVGDGRDLVLFGDTFNRYLRAREPRGGRARARGRRLPPAPGRAARRRAAALLRPHLPVGRPRRRGAAGGARTLDALAPFVAQGARVVGLEPSCLLTFRDEFAALLPKAEVEPLAAAAFLFEEALAADLAAGRVSLPLADQGGRTAHLHGHCHQKAFGAMGAVETRAAEPCRA